MKSLKLLLVLLLLHTTSHAQQNNYLYRCNEKLIEIAMEDLFTPPVASRVYVYPNIAAYEVLALGNSGLKSLSGQIKHLPALKMENAAMPINYSLAAEIAFTTVARKLVFTENKVNEFEETEKNQWKNSISDEKVFQNSVAFGKQAGAQIIEWMMKDNYVTVKTMQRYELLEGNDKWRPTAPEYTNALEPNWSKMRPLVMDSAGMIRPIPPTPYSEKKNSAFYKLAMDVYLLDKNCDEEQRIIASFWDCNPNISHSEGHITVFEHRISPGGHWIKITGQAVKNLNLDEASTAEAYTLTTIGIYEGFISCWTEKYRLNTIRPETYIQRLIDPKFLPLIQTPPFPEYPSGHSVVSATASTILMQVIPQPYSFTDSSEMYINLPARTFNSFAEAALEASVSRFYGGIHFMAALDNGAQQGQEIGKFIRSHLQTRKKQ